MKTNLLIRARRNFNSPHLTRAANRAHQRKWVRILRFLGPKWVGIAQPVDRGQIS